MTSLMPHLFVAVGGHAVVLRRLEGAEEAEYWKEVCFVVHGGRCHQGINQHIWQNEPCCVCRQRNRGTISSPPDAGEEAEVVEAEAVVVVDRCEFIIVLHEAM